MDAELRTLIGQWKLKADHDLIIAQRDLISDNPLTDIICFHSQQAVEKYLKMYLVLKGQDPAKTHHIGILLEECTKVNPDFVALQDVEYLTDYAVSLRYPDNFYMPLIDEAKDSVAQAARVKDFIELLLDNELNSE